MQKYIQGGDIMWWVQAWVLVRADNEIQSDFECCSYSLFYSAHFLLKF